jgi:hypothetical protein
MASKSGAVRRWGAPPESISDDLCERIDVSWRIGVLDIAKLLRGHVGQGADRLGRERQARGLRIEARQELASANRRTNDASAGPTSPEASRRRARSKTNQGRPTALDVPLASEVPETIAYRTLRL